MADVWRWKVERKGKWKKWIAALVTAVLVMYGSVLWDMQAIRAE